MVVRRDDCLTCRERVEEVGGGKKRSHRAAVDEGESVTDPRELEIESNFLGLALSPPPFSFLQKPTIILSL